MVLNITWLDPNVLDPSKMLRHMDKEFKNASDAFRWCKGNWAYIYEINGILTNCSKASIYKVLGKDICATCDNIQVCNIVPNECDYYLRK